MKMVLKVIVAVSLLSTLHATAFANPHDRPRDRPLPPPSHPQPYPNPPVDFDRRLYQLERDLRDTNTALYQLQVRVEQLERGSYPPAPPAPPVPPRESIANCLVVDSGFNKTFLGSGLNRIDAEFSARRACESNVSSSFCNPGALFKCDDTYNFPYDQKFVCIMKDKGFSKMFRGEGRTAIEAEAKAKEACQSSVSPSFCGLVEVRCDSSPR